MTIKEAFEMYLKFEFVIIFCVIFIHILSILFSENNDRMPWQFYPFIFIFSTIIFLIVIFLRYFI